MTHASRPLVGVFVSFAGGIVVQEWLRCEPWVLATLLVVLIGTAGIFRCRRWSGWLLVAAFFALGLLRAQATQRLPPGDIYYQVHKYYAGQINVTGVVASPPVHRTHRNGERTDFDFLLESVSSNDDADAVSGRVRVRMYRPAEVSVGDRVRLRGLLHVPFDFARNGTSGRPQRFSYRRFLRRRGIVFLFSVKKGNPVTVIGPSGRLRVARWFQLRAQQGAAILQNYLSPRAAGVMAAVLLGDRSRIPDEVEAAFIHTGTSHVLAISGLHVGMVAAVLLVLVRLFPVPRRGQYAITLVLLAGYAALTGGRPSVVRAVIMSSMFLFGYILEREQDSFNTLALAGLLILLLKPLDVFAMGFQLSFASVAALAGACPPLLARLRSWPPAQRLSGLRWMLSSLVVSLAAWLGAAGLVAYHFAVITPWAVAANLIIVPFMTGVVVLGIGTVLCGMLLPGLAGLFAVCLALWLRITEMLAVWFDGWPATPVDNVFVPGWGVVMYYLVLVGVVILLRSENNVRVLMVGLLRRVKSAC